MALILEDGTGRADAQSYIDVAWADAYFAARSVVEWVGLDTLKEGAIVRAMDYVETTWTFLGRPEFEAQALKWPRVGIYEDGRAVEGIPVRLQRAVAEYALRALSGPLQPDPVADDRGLAIKSKREKLGPLEEETVYQDGAVVQGRRLYPAADRLLAGYVLATNRVIRA